MMMEFGADQKGGVALQGGLVQVTFRKIQDGLFENQTTTEIQERSCIC